MNEIEKLRNIVFVGHGGSGKTSLAEVMLFNSGVTTRLGRTEEENTVMDFEPEELKRHSSLSSGFHQYPWKQNTISLIDTPGDQNFFSDTRLCMQAAEGVIIVLDGVDGVRYKPSRQLSFPKNLICLVLCLSTNSTGNGRTFSEVFRMHKIFLNQNLLLYNFPLEKKPILKALSILCK